LRLRGLPNASESGLFQCKALQIDASCTAPILAPRHHCRHLFPAHFSCSITAHRSRKPVCPFGGLDRPILTFDWTVRGFEQSVVQSDSRPVVGFGVFSPGSAAMAAAWSFTVRLV